MRHLRRSIIIFLVYTTVFYNIERLDLGTPDLINLSTFVYGLNLLAVVSIVALPPLWRASGWVSLTLWLGVYALARLFIFNTRPLFGGIDTYLSIAEVALLTLSLVLAHRLARQLHDFEEAVKNITFADIHRRIKSMEEAEHEIQLALHRSRRQQYPLTVVIVEPDSASIQVAMNRTVQEVQHAMITRYALASLARTISNQLRRTDLVLDQRDRGRFVIVSYDANVTSALGLAGRIQSAAAKELGVKVACGLAAFPDEAVTFEGLLHKAEAALRTTAEPSRASAYTLDPAKRI
jgi:GGDEF domain-containing protein